MTNQEKAKVLDLRESGDTYRDIATLFGVSVNTIKSICRWADEKKDCCKNCGKPFFDSAKRKNKIFCCEWCRRAWWKTHRNQTRQVARYADCKGCGHRFKYYGKAKRTYCSHQCYIKARFGGKPDGVP
jgi:hypothetical protein